MHIDLRNDSESYTNNNMRFNNGSVSSQSLIFQSVLLSCFITVSSTGNALVILGFVVDKRLRTPSNYFLLNLAISDFITGTFTLPVYLKSYIIDRGWYLGKSFCKAFVAVNCTLCQCTIYNIVLISYDRFLAVAKAVKYRDQQNKLKLAFLKMAAVWIIAFLNFGPAIIFWEYLMGYSGVPEGECRPDYLYNSRYLLYSSIFDFFIPMTALAFFNLSIFYNICFRMRSKSVRRCTKLNDLSLDHEKKDIYVIEYKYVNNSIPVSQQNLSKKNKLNILELFLSICNCKSEHTKERKAEVTTQYNKPDSVQQGTLDKDKKIAKSLTVLVCTFLICWAPISLITIISEAFCHECYFSPIVYEVANWFFFLNSSINPFIYPLCHPAFKKTLIQMLCVKNQKVGERMHCMVKMIKPCEI